MRLRGKSSDSYPNIAKAGEIQSQDAKGAAVVIYCNPLATPGFSHHRYSVITGHTPSPLKGRGPG
jgi:hypothetical protein